MKSFKDLTIGSVVNCNKSTAQVYDLVCLGHYDSGYWRLTRFLNKETNEVETYGSDTEIKNEWSMVKENTLTNEVYFNF